MIARRDQRAPAQHRILVSASFTVIAHRPSSRAAKARVNSSGMCCTITIPGVSAGKRFEQRLQGFRSARGSADHHDFLRGLCHGAPRGRRQNSVRRQLRFHHAPRARPAQPRSRRRFHRLAQRDARILQKLAHPQPRLRHNLHRADIPAPRARSARPSSARLEQITTGIGCCIMIFFRNVSPSIRGISMSSVITSGTCSAMLLRRHKGIARGADHLDLRIRREHVRQRLAHHCRVVHNQHANLLNAHRIASCLSFAPSRCAPATGSASLQSSRRSQHVPRRCIEINVHSRDGPPRRDAATCESLLLQHLQRQFAVQPAHRRPRDSLICHQQHIARRRRASLRLVAPGAQGIELRGQIANGEVHIAQRRGHAQLASRRRRAAWQHGMAECADPQPRMPKVTPTQEPSSVRRIAGRAPDAILPAAHRSPAISSASAIGPPVQRRRHRLQRKIHVVQRLGVADKQNTRPARDGG